MDNSPSSFPGTLPRVEALTAVLTSLFFGAFTVLAAFALFFTTRQSFRRISTIAGVSVIVALFALSATYTIAVLVKLGHQTHILDSDLYHAPALDCIGTAVLTLTTVFTNAVVWSRVWALWKHNKIIYGASLLLLLALATLLAGAFGTSDYCPASLNNEIEFSANNLEFPMGGFYWDSNGGTAAAWFAMVSNIVAFILYLIKALKLPSEKVVSLGRSISCHFVRFLESGALFAIFWLLMVVYMTGSLGEDFLTTRQGFSFFVNGALISLLVRPVSIPPL